MKHTELIIAIKVKQIKVFNENWPLQNLTFPYITIKGQDKGMPTFFLLWATLLILHADDTHNTTNHLDATLTTIT